MAGLRSAWLIVPLVASCNVLFGVDDLELRKPPRSFPIGSGGGMAGSAGAAGEDEMGGGGALGGGGAGGKGGDGGGGGAPMPICGDGAINQVGEQCDDGALTSGDGCSATCQVECTGSGHYLNMTTLHCYRRVTTNTEWLVASADCAAWSGTLASVTSDEERLFLDSYVVNDTWIGLNDLTVDGTFTWENGEPVGTFPWESGAPAASPNAQDCVVLQANTLFDDQQCSQLHDYFCERNTGLP